MQKQLLIVYIQLAVSTFLIPNRFVYLAFEDDQLHSLYKFAKLEYLNNLTNVLLESEYQRTLSNIKKYILENNYEQIQSSVDLLVNSLFDNEYLRHYEEILKLDKNIYKKYFIDDIMAINQIRAKDLDRVYIEMVNTILENNCRLCLIKALDIASSLSTKDFIIETDSLLIQKSNINDENMFEHFYTLLSKNRRDIRIKPEITTFINSAISNIMSMISNNKQNLIINLNMDYIFVNYIYENLKEERIIFNFQMYVFYLDSIIEIMQCLILKCEQYKVANFDALELLKEKYIIFINPNPYPLFDIYWKAFSSKFYFNNEIVADLDTKYVIVEAKIKIMREKMLELMTKLFQ